MAVCLTRRIVECTFELCLYYIGTFVVLLSSVFDGWICLAYPYTLGVCHGAMSSFGATKIITFPLWLLFLGHIYIYIYCSVDLNAILFFFGLYICNLFFLFFCASKRNLQSPIFSYLSSLCRDGEWSLSVALVHPTKYPGLGKVRCVRPLFRYLEVANEWLGKIHALRNWKLPIYTSQLSSALWGPLFTHLKS